MPRPGTLTLVALGLAGLLTIPAYAAKPAPAPAAQASRPAPQSPPLKALSVHRQKALEHEERVLRRAIWRLRMRRRDDRAGGRALHAHRLSQRIHTLGWRLRRIQATLVAHRGHH